MGAINFDQLRIGGAGGACPLVVVVWKVPVLRPMGVMCRLPRLWDHHVASHGATDSSAEVEQVLALSIGERRVPERPISGMSGRSGGPESSC